MPQPQMIRATLGTVAAALLTLWAAAGYAQVFDTSPPQLVTLSFAPSAVDVTTVPQQVTVTATVTDDLSGTNSLVVQFASPSGQRQPPVPAILSRISGTVLTGVYEGVFEIPPFVEPGIWAINLLFLRDAAGNSVSLQASDLRGLGLPTDLAVTSIPDTTPPQVAEITLSSNTIDVSAASQSVTVTLHLTDAGTGVDFGPGGTGTLQFSGPPESPGVSQLLVGEDFTLVSGTPQDGIWQAIRSFPRASPAGTWTLNLVLRDKVGNVRFFFTDELRALGLTTDLTVISDPSDTTPPQVTGLTFTPSTIDTSASARTITVTMTLIDDLTGVDFSPETPNLARFHGLRFDSPSGGQVRFASPLALIAGNELNGTWQATAFFPQFSEGGTWTARILGIEDAVNNSTSLDTADLVSRNLPSELIVFGPSQVPDGTVGPGGGTVDDEVFGSRAALTIPPSLLQEATNVAIDVLTSSPSLPTPAGFSAGTLFVNIALSPMPAMPFPAPGLSLVLPFSDFRVPGTPIWLYRLDPASGLLVPAPTVSGGNVIGTVNADGLSAAFAGVSKLSTVVGFFPTAVPGDVNADGAVNCVDLALIRAAFGKRAGQAGFDPRADMNQDRAVDVNDLAMVSRQLPAGTRCQ